MKELHDIKRIWDEVVNTDLEEFTRKNPIYMKSQYGMSSSSSTFCWTFIRGKTGATGPTGATGETGATGTNISANSMTATLTPPTSPFVIFVPPEGINLPLPNNQKLDGFIAVDENRAFIVPEDGRYTLRYSITSIDSFTLITRLVRNNTVEINASKSGGKLTDKFAAETQENLIKGDKISLQVMGENVILNFAGNGIQGAFLTIQRLE
ncbi:collagen-like triple helix repeat-containing protein [Brevibacillus laterosporus]|uniref:BclA C-terminal domain-containing protein n=1 Tax=Brevibacillus laterosporus TaxID=1465 RepID=UPI0024050D63|nr:collagen-like triple helix repeat-containing protein [Brevibacillus laterosporus]MDF9410593.1 collagen-like triple helix repeat-containing protein [Brevibacillus laterosporus]